VNARRTAIRHAVALAASLLAAACADEPAVAGDRLLVVDGIEFTLADVAPYTAFLGSFVPESGEKTRVRLVLEEYLVPLRLAQRAFPDLRQRALARARGLCEVATNAAELDAQSHLLEQRQRGTMSRRRPQLPVAMFLFDPMKVGSVSEPIEVPVGYVVAAAFDLHESALMVDDYVDSVQVPFVTHDGAGWTDWLAAEKERVSTLVSYVHPEYRQAMPSWLQLPKLP